MTTTNIRRQDAFKEGLDARGIRRTRVGDKQKTHTPLGSFAAEIVLPDEFTSREVPGKGDKPAIPYREYRLPVENGYILANDMRANPSSPALISVKEKEMRNGTKVFKVFYLKIEDTDQPATHTFSIARDEQALDKAIDNKVEGQLFYDLSIFGTRMSGGIIVTPIDAN
jgi:hypothetical protein